MDDIDRQFPYLRFLRVPFIFIPYGSAEGPEVAAFKAAHPGWVKLRATFVPHQQPALEPEPQPSAAPDVEPEHWAPPVPFHAQAQQRTRVHRAAMAAGGAMRAAKAGNLEGAPVAAVSPSDKVSLSPQPAETGAQPVVHVSPIVAPPRALFQLVADDGTPGNNQAQNAQVNSIVRVLGLNKDQRRQLHDEITGQNLGYQQILKIAKDMFGE
jgi:hypothetical protein